MKFPRRFPFRWNPGTLFGLPFVFGSRDLYSFPYVFVGHETPADRTLIVRVSRRVFTVEPDLRTLTVPRNDRTLIA